MDDAKRYRIEITHEAAVGWFREGWWVEARPVAEDPLLPRDRWLESWRAARLARHLGERLHRRGASSRAELDLELSTIYRLGSPDRDLSYRAFCALTGRGMRPALPSAGMVVRQATARLRRQSRAERLPMRRAA